MRKTIYLINKFSVTCLLFLFASSIMAMRNGPWDDDWREANKIRNLQEKIDKSLIQKDIRALSVLIQNNPQELSWMMLQIADYPKNTPKDSETILHSIIKNNPLIFTQRELTTLLNFAANNNSIILAKVTLQDGANIQGNQFSAPLIEAAQKGHISMIKFLIENGADLLIDDKILYHKKSILEAAAQEGFQGIFLRDKKDILETEYTLLATIPLEEARKIKEQKENIFLIKTGQLFPKDVRRIINTKLVVELVADHMQYVNQVIKKSIQLIEERQRQQIETSENDLTLLEIAFLKGPFAKQEIEKRSRNNIKRILFGEPKETKQPELTPEQKERVNEFVKAFEMRKMENRNENNK